jgi:hypothetical protein
MPQAQCLHGLANVGGGGPRALNTGSTETLLAIAREGAYTVEVVTSNRNGADMDEEPGIVKLSARCRACGTVFETGYLKNRLRVTSADEACPKCEPRVSGATPKSRRPPLRAPSARRPAPRPARSA